MNVNNNLYGRPKNFIENSSYEVKPLDYFTNIIIDDKNRCPLTQKEDRICYFKTYFDLVKRT